jgi:DNA adenine methylase
MAEARAIPPCFPYFGGKNRSARLIATYLPPSDRATIHVEPFCGGLSVLFAKSPYAAAINDGFGLLVNFWSVLNQEYEAFQEWMENWAMPMEGLMLPFRDADPATQEGRFKRALFFYWHLNYGFSGKWGGSGPFDHFCLAGVFSKRSRILRKTFKPWATALRAAHALITNYDYKTFFQKVSESGSRETKYFYVDPPYYNIKALYGGGDFTEQDHRDLFNILQGREELWLLSYNDAPALRDLYSSFHIKELTFKYSCNVKFHDAIDATELLISNQPIRQRDARPVSILDRYLDPGVPEEESGEQCGILVEDS